jgi:hypothetical protein
MVITVEVETRGRGERKRKEGIMPELSAEVSRKNAGSPFEAVCCHRSLNEGDYGSLGRCLTPYP